MVWKNPIRKFELIGDWDTNHGFKNVDRALLRSPKGVAKIKDYFERTPFIFDVYLVNTSRANNPKYRGIGAVPPEYLARMGLTGQNINPDPDAISIVYTNNYGADKYHFSAWIMAHRFGHALAASVRYSPVPNYDFWPWKEYSDYVIENLLRRTAKEIWLPQPVYYTPGYLGYRDEQSKLEKIMRWLAMQLGTMRTARDRTLRTAFEFPYELLAQYLLTGRVKLNPITWRLQKSHYDWGRPSYLYAGMKNEKIESFNSNLPSFEAEIEGLIENLLESAVGQIFVM